MSTPTSNPKILKKQITCNDSFKTEISTNFTTVAGGAVLNRTNSLSAQNANPILHKNSSESNHLHALESGNWVILILSMKPSKQTQTK